MRSPIYAIRALLANSVDLSGHGVGMDQIHYMKQDQGASYPNVVVVPVTSFMTELLAGMSYPISARFSVDCRSEDAEQSHAIGEAVIAALNDVNYQEVLGGEFLIQECRLVGDVPAVDDGSDVYRRILDFRLHYSPGGVSP